MANKYNVYTPTQYVPLPIEEYRHTLGALDTEAVGKVQQLGAGLNAYRGIQGIGADAQAYHKSLLDAITKGTEEIARKNLNSFDATKAISALINDPNTISGMKSLYQDSIEYTKMNDALVKYREKNPDINLTPQLAAIHAVSKNTVGDAKAYRPGRFRNLDSVPEYYDVKKALFEVLDKKKGSSREWQSSDGKRVYKTYEEALTDPEIKKAAFDTLNADARANDQIRRNMSYEAFLTNPDDPNTYYGKVGQSVRDELQSEIETNSQMIKNIDAQLSKKNMKISDRKQLEITRQKLEGRNKGNFDAMNADDYTLARQTHVNKFAQAGADIFSYNKSKQTWEYDQLYLENIKHQHGLSKLKYAADLKDKQMNKFFMPQVNNMGKTVLGVSTNNPTDAANLSLVPGFEKIAAAGGDVRKFEFGKVIGKKPLTMQDLASMNILSADDIGRNLLTGAPYIKDSGSKKLIKAGIQGTALDGYYENVKLNKSELVNNLRTAFPGIEVAANLPKVDWNNVSDNEALTMMAKAAEIAHTNQKVGVDQYAPGGITGKAISRNISDKIIKTISDRTIMINGVPYEANKLPTIQKNVNGKMVPISIQEAMQDKNVEPTFTEIYGRRWAMYDLPDESGVNKKVMIAYPDMDAQLGGGNRLGNNSGFSLDGDRLVYTEKKLIPGEQGGWTFGSKVYPEVGIGNRMTENGEVFGPAGNIAGQYVSEYISKVPNPEGKDVNQLAEDAYNHLNFLADEYSRTKPMGGISDPITGRKIANPVKVFREPSTGKYDLRYAAFEGDVTDQKGNPIAKGAMYGTDYSEAQWRKAFNHINANEIKQVNTKWQDIFNTGLGQFDFLNEDY